MALGSERLEKKFSYQLAALNKSLEGSFSALKEDIIDLKRNKNSNLFEIEKMHAELNTRVSEADFYIIIKKRSRELISCRTVSKN